MSFGIRRPLHPETHNGRFNFSEMSRTETGPVFEVLVYQYRRKKSGRYDCFWPVGHTLSQCIRRLVRHVIVTDV